MIEFFQSQRHHFERAFASFDLTKQQAHALYLLANEGPRAMSELAECLACDASNVTGLIDRLEARGLVERRSDPTDRRKRMLALTPAGAKLHRRVRERIAAAPPAIAALGIDDLLSLREILGKAMGEARTADAKHRTAHNGASETSSGPRRYSKA